MGRGQFHFVIEMTFIIVYDKFVINELRIISSYIAFEIFLKVGSGLQKSFILGGYCNKTFGMYSIFMVFDGSTGQYNRIGNIPQTLVRLFMSQSIGSIDVSG